MTNCGGGPRLQFMAGRSNVTRPAPDLTVPEPFDSVDKIFLRMLDAGFLPKEVVALLASHSTAAQDHVDPTIPVSVYCLSYSQRILTLFYRVPRSTQPSALSTTSSSLRYVEHYYLGANILSIPSQTLLTGTLFPGNGSNQGELLSPLPGEFRLQSDFAIAHDSRYELTP